MTLTTNEKRTVFEVFDILVSLGRKELHKFMDSETISEMYELYNELKFEEYCKAHDLKSYKEMTDLDFETYYHDKYDS